MKLLLDQNISFRLVAKLSKDFPGTNQVKSLGPENSSDKEIWEFARDNDAAILTFDADFYDYSVVWGHPPKIVWLRTGNMTSAQIQKMLIKHRVRLKDFADEEQIACLELYQ